MIQAKMLYVYLANLFGFSCYFLGIFQVTDGWKQNVLFVLGVIFMAIKVVNAVLDLRKKKPYWMRRLRIHVPGGNLKNQNPKSKVYTLNVERDIRNIKVTADSRT